MCSVLCQALLLGALEADPLLIRMPGSCMCVKLPWDQDRQRSVMTNMVSAEMSGQRCDGVTQCLLKEEKLLVIRGCRPAD